MEAEGGVPYNFVLLWRYEGECRRQQASGSADCVQLYLGGAGVLRFQGGEGGECVIGGACGFKE